jgi:ELWxxDGT repeat protein
MSTNLHRRNSLISAFIVFIFCSINAFCQTPVLVKDIRTGTNHSDPQELVNVNGTIFFSAIDGPNGIELWKSDGTNAGTVLVKDIYPSGSSNPQHLVNVNGVLFFIANNNTNGYELWKSDGTSAGTVLVKDINPGLSNSNPDNLTNVNGVLFFSAADGTNGAELWKSDGSTAGTVIVKDIYTGVGNAQPQNLCNSGGTLFFSADNGATNGIELWKSDGTAAGTVMIKDIYSGTGNSNPGNITSVGNIVFFKASEGTNGIELWKTDGTTAGTIMVLDINTGVSNSDPDYFTDIDGTLFFTANKSGQGAELWKSDGTGAGTVLVKDIRSGAQGSTPQFITNVNGTAFLTATDGTAGIELWKSDGTTAGTVQVKDIKPGAGASTPDKLCNLNGILFFQAEDGTNGFELWKSDGTGAGTSLVQDIRTGTANSNPTYLIAVEGELFFQAEENTYGKELWKYGYCTAYSLAGTAGGAAVSLTKPMNCLPYSFYQDKTCNLIAKIQPSGANYVNGNVISKVKIDASVQTYNGQPYLQRHYDIIPALNASTATATVTLYFTQAEFDNYNSSNGSFSDLPVNSGDVAGKSMLLITQYHGTSGSGNPGTYSGSSELINPADANIIWNATQSRWEVTFNVNGFSGFFVHTGFTILPVLFVTEKAGLVNGRNQVNWTITEPQNINHFVIERSNDAGQFVIAATLPAGQSRTEYQFAELSAATQKTSYRIKVVLNDGSEVYSRILTVNKPESRQTLKLYPNPVTDKLYFEYDAAGSAIDISIFSTDGRRHYHEIRLPDSSRNNSVDVASLKPGNYIFKLSNIKTGLLTKRKFLISR